MKLLLKYPTRERVWHNDNVFSPVMKEATLSVARVLRTPCGNRRTAARRYYYVAVVPAPEDADHWAVLKGFLHLSIDRRKNRHFQPNKLDWQNNRANIQDNPAAESDR